MNADQYRAAQTLFRAFCHLHRRMKPADPMSHPNPEFLAGCVLHACLATLLAEIREQNAQRFDAPEHRPHAGWHRSATALGRG
jgi:hypothetical protein